MFDQRLTTMKGTLLFLLVAVTFAAWAKETPQKPSGNMKLPGKPVELALQPYRRGMRTLRVDVNGKRHLFLFDTGGGFTVISPELADRVGCVPYGRLTGFRMSGERLDVPQCGPVKFGLDGLVIEPETSVLDIAALLPEDWPRLDGSLSLQSFRHHAITLDLAGNRLIVETPESLEERTREMYEMRMFLATSAGGRAVDLFVEARAGQGALRLLVDSGDVVGFILAPHALKQLGVVPPADNRLENQRIEIVGLNPVTTPIVVEDVIHDGVVGAAFLERLVLTIDLRNRRMWGRFHR